MQPWGKINWWAWEEEGQGLTGSDNTITCMNCYLRSVQDRWPPCIIAANVHETQSDC